MVIWIHVAGSLTAILLPAILMDLIAGRRGWRWAFGYPIDDPNDSLLWRRVTLLRTVNGILALAALATFLIAGEEVATQAVAVYWVVLFALWLGLARKYLPRPDHPRRFVVDVAPPRVIQLLRPRWEFWIWLVVLIPVIAAPAVIPHLPEKIPVQWNGAGISRWGNSAELYGLAALGIILQLLCAALILSVFRSPGPRVPVGHDPQPMPLLVPGIIPGRLEKTEANPEAPPTERLRELVDQEKAGVLGMIQWVRLMVAVTLTVVWIGVVTVGAAGDPELVWPFIGGVTLLELLLLGVVGFQAMKLIQIRQQMKDLGFDPVADRAEGYIWGGIAYFDRDDPSLWVPKRIGIGYTLNMAQPSAWLIMGAITAVVVASVTLPLVL